MIIDIVSGPHPKPDADVRMDMHQWGNVNCLHNLIKIPYPLESETFDKAYMGDVIEHIYIFKYFFQCVRRWSIGLISFHCKLNKNFESSPLCEENYFCDFDFTQKRKSN